ncbi:S1 family peptidase, partial [Actinoplanes sp. NPDC048791]
MNRRPAAVLTALLSAAVAAALAVTVPADAGTSGAGPDVTPSGVAPAMFTALQRDLRLTPAQVTEHLATDQRAGRIEEVLRKTLGTRYAGTWVSSGGTAVTAGVNDDAAVAAVRALGAQPVRVR